MGIRFYFCWLLVLKWRLPPPTSSNLDLEHADASLRQLDSWFTALMPLLAHCLEPFIVSKRYDSAGFIRRSLCSVQEYEPFVFCWRVILRVLNCTMSIPVKLPARRTSCSLEDHVAYTCLPDHSRAITFSYCAHGSWFSLDYRGALVK